MRAGSRGFWAATLLGLAALGACGEAQGPAAPTDAQACWRLNPGAAGKASYSLVSTGDENLQTCAVHLEAVRLRESHDLNGAYEGQYIYASAEELSWSARADTAHFAVLTPAQRDQVDAALRQELAARAAAAAKAEAAGSHPGPKP